MSEVTNVLVTVDIREGRDVLSHPIDGDMRGQMLRNIADDQAGDFWGGSKRPECDVWAAALNFVSTDMILAHVAAVQWRSPENVLVLIEGQYDSRFTVYAFKDGELAVVW